MKYNVTIRTSVEADNFDEAMDKVAEFTWFIPVPKDTDITEAETANSVLSIEK